jgi:mannitol-1-phosphate 5-dehydrogenase
MKTKQAVVYGAGNIGRGFIGAALSASDYAVTFIDVAADVVDALNSRNKYPVRILHPDGHREEEIVSDVRAVNADKDFVAAAKQIAAADICATAVGVRILPYIVPVLTDGFLRRLSADNPEPLNVIVCENQIGAAARLKGMVRDSLPGLGQESDNLRARFDATAGFVETSIGRMVPVQTDALKDGDPLRVAVEPYDFLPVDKAGFVGQIPDVRGMHAFDCFEFWHKRKLFLHNLGHAVCAYLGLLKGYTYTWEAVLDPDILAVTRAAMEESATALSAEYYVRGTEGTGEGLESVASPAELAAHIDDLLTRFSNRMLRDTCSRVAADPVRKLGPHDRLIGAAKNCSVRSLPYVNIVRGAAAALTELLKETGKVNAETTLASVSGLSADDPVAIAILECQRKSFIMP